MENITTAEVMEKLDMFQSRFGKMDQFGWWDLERISADADTQFTSTEFKEEYQTRGVCLTLVAPEHQEINVQVEVGSRYTAGYRPRETASRSILNLLRWKTGY